MSILLPIASRLPRPWPAPKIACHYLEVNNNKENLVVCFGDSWTYGDSLGNTDASKGIDDYEFRQKHLYGRVLADKLDADFVNEAVPGCSNNYIHDSIVFNFIKNDLQRVATQYKNVYIVITLTETGRELKITPHLDWFLGNFKKFYDYQSDKEFTFEKLLIQIERFNLSQLAEHEKQFPSNVKLIVARNFAYTFDSNMGITKNMVPKIWTEILAEKQNIDPVRDVRMASFACSDLGKYMESVSNNYSIDVYKKYVDWYEQTIMIPANKQIDFLNKSVYNYKKASKHPTPEGHTIWADYLYNYLITINNETDCT